MRRRLFSIMSMLLVLTFVLGACSNAATGGNSGKKIIWAVHNEADSLDPGFTSNTFAGPVIINAFEPLITYDADNNIVPGLAESWDVSDDGLVYLFKLRKGLKWSDGSPLTAADFEYSWLRVLDKTTAAQYSGMLTDYIAGAKEYFDGTGDRESLGIIIPDENTIEIRLIAPTPFFLGILNMYPYNAVKKDVVEGNADTWAKDAKTYISNGPFMVSEIKFGEGVRLVKNKHYWNAENVKLEEVYLRLIPEKSTALTAFESGEIDGVYDVPVDDIPRLKAESDDMYASPQFATTYFILNCEKEPFNDVRVRKALSLALNREALIDNVLQTADLPASGLIAPGYMVDGKDYTASRADYDITAQPNLELAKQLLEEAGYKDGEGFPKVTLSYYTDSNVKKFTEAMQQMWKENLGIDMEITTEEWKVYYDNIKAGNYDVGAMGWGGDYLHPMTFLAGFVSDSELNNSNYANPSYDALIKEATATVDAAQGAALMHQAEDILVGEDHAIINLFYRSRYVMFSPNVDGWFLTPLNYIYFKNADKLA